MKPENTPVGSVNQAANLHKTAMNEAANAAISDAERSASAAAAIASASQAAEAAEEASTKAAAEAAKQRATYRAQSTAGVAAASMAAPAAGASATAAPGTATPFTNPAHPSAVAVAGANHHKVGKGFIAALVILGVAAVAALGCALWFFLVYSQPTTVAKDAFARLLSADRVSAVANVALESTDLNGTGNLGFSYGKTEGFYLKADGSFTDNQNSLTYTGNLGLLAPNYEQYYLTVGGIDDIYTSALNSSLESEGLTEAGYTIEDLESMSPELASLHQLITEIDGSWWTLTSTDDEATTNYVAFNQCLVSSLGSEASVHDYVSTYDQYPFLSAEKHTDPAIDSTDTYKISIDEQQFTNFLNQIYGDVIYPAVSTCAATNSIDTSSLSADDEITLSEVQELHLNDELEHMVFEIDGFSHQLKKIYYTISSDDEDAKLAVVTEFSYPASVSFTAPEDARDLTELEASLNSTLPLFFGGAAQMSMGSPLNQGNNPYNDVDYSGTILY